MLNKLTIFFLIVGVLVAVLDINFTTAVQSNADTQCHGDDCAAADFSKQQADSKPDSNTEINVSDEKNHITDDDNDENDESEEGVRSYDEDDEDDEDVAVSDAIESRRRFSRTRRRSSRRRISRREISRRRSSRRRRLIRSWSFQKTNPKKDNEEDDEEFVPCEWEWSECSVTCGEGIQTSDVIWKSDDDTDCDPPKSRKCNLIPCE